VTQPDHARISGELASAFESRKVPNVSEAIVRAISMHDIGWMQYDGDLGSPCAPTTQEPGVPLSFANTQPEQFLRAWLGSIQAAQSTGPLGGLIVSAHFARLTHPYLDRGAGTPQQREQVEQFLHREASRVERLLPLAGVSPEEIEALIAVLQFCDLASLYLCANPAAPVELPQVLDGGRVQLSFEQGSFQPARPRARIGDSLRTICGRESATRISTGKSAIKPALALRKWSSLSLVPRTMRK
jgi:hypothetical protein